MPNYSFTTTLGDCVKKVWELARASQSTLQLLFTPHQASCCPCQMGKGWDEMLLTLNATGSKITFYLLEKHFLPLKHQNEFWLTDAPLKQRKKYFEKLQNLRDHISVKSFNFKKTLLKYDIAIAIHFSRGSHFHQRKNRWMLTSENFVEQIRKASSRNIRWQMHHEMCW
jgi:hypothetical protein